MSAEVTIRSNGKAEMAALEGVAVWWEDDAVKAGRLKEGASIEEWTTAAGMDFLIKKVALKYYADRAQTKLLTVPDQIALIRSDTGETLGIASPDYQIVQPFEILEFFRDLVGESGFKLTTAGTLFGGKRFWALAKITDATIAGWDKIGAYLLLTTSADGSMSTEGRQVSICVVCANTLRIAFNQAKARARVSHRTRFDDKKLKADLGLTAGLFAGFIEQANALSQVKVSDAIAEDFVMTLLRGGVAQAEIQTQVSESSPDDSFAALLAKPFIPADIEVEAERVRRPRGMDAILALFEGEGMGATQKGRAGTAWGLVNAVTEYTDHHATAKTQDHRVARAWYGTGDALKVDAMQQAVEQFL